MGIEMKIIAHIETDFTEKFGIPRQSGLVETRGRIVFEPKYRNPDALRGIESFSHLWLIWEFSKARREEWSPTVRPPRLGGNTRRGVFATRSPYRPNPIGLSSVRLLSVDTECADAPVLYVAGADLLDGTPIFDIKPYLAYTDAHPDARDGFALSAREGTLNVDFPEALRARFLASKFNELCALLAQDPRPGYQDEPCRVYGMTFAGYDVRFTVSGSELSVCDVKLIDEKQQKKREES